MQLPPATQTIGFFAMDIVGHFWETCHSRPCLLFILNRYAKVNRAIPTSRTTDTHIAVFHIYPIPPPQALLTYFHVDEKVQIINTIFAAICALFRGKCITAPIYHPLFFCKLLAFKRNSFTRLRRYVVEQQKNWDTVVHTIVYAYNTQILRSKNQTVINLFSSLHSY